MIRTRARTPAPRLDTHPCHHHIVCSQGHPCPALLYRPPALPPPPPISKRDLEREATETQAKQVELDKTAEDFRQMHRERQDLVRQWQDSIEVVKERDVEIAKAAEDFAVRAGQSAPCHPSPGSCTLAVCAPPADARHVHVCRDGCCGGGWGSG